MYKTVRYYATIVGLLVMVLAGRLAFDISVGEHNIPITGQSLAVLLIGYYSHQKEILLVFIAYLLLGAVGLPVFADGEGGLEHLWGKSGGYLYSFPISAILVAKLRQGCKSTVARLLLFLLATMIILFIGMLHLGTFIGLADALRYGVYPYINGGVIKCLLALLITLLIDRIVDYY